MKGKLPNTMRIKLASNTGQWRLIEKRLINELSCSGTIKRNEESTVKVQLVLTKVVSPKNHSWKSSVEISGTKNLEMKNGLERIKEFFDHLCNQNIWILTGYIDGSNKLPIVILYYELFDTSVYNIKYREESFTDFLPEGVLPSRD
jgi:hypothetical protein